MSVRAHAFFFNHLCNAASLIADRPTTTLLFWENLGYVFVSDVSVQQDIVLYNISVLYGSVVFV